MLTASRTGRIDVLRLHTDPSGCVWQGDDNLLGSNSYQEPEEFVVAAADDLARTLVLRVLGTAGNAGLITRLHDWKTANPRHKTRLYVGSPALLGTVAQRSDPETVLQYLWQPPGGLCASRWHELFPFDYATYALIEEMQGKIRLTEKAMRIAHYHPCWPVVEFVGSANAEYVCRLIVDIVDPRWYVHSGRPGRPNRLYAHLGLSPDNMLSILDPHKPCGHNFGRARNAVLAWYGDKPQKRYPGDVAWRSFVLAPDNVRGLLRGTKKFVDFMRLTWLASVSPTLHEFDARKFFRHPDDAAAYGSYRQNWRPV